MAVKGSKRNWYIAGGVAAALLIAGTAYAAVPRKLPKRKGMTEADAMDKAVRRLGSAANPHSIAKMACAFAYPDGCSEANLASLYGLVTDYLGPESKNIAPPDGPVSGSLVEQVSGWLDSLTQDQRDGLRKILGPAYYDPVQAAALAGDNITMDAEIVRLYDLGLKLYAEDKMTALQKYAKLQALLGPKLNELVQFIA